MLPTTGKTSPTPEELKRPTVSLKTKKVGIGTAFHSVKTQISSRRCAWLSVTIFLQLLIILYLNRASPLHPPSDTQRRHFEDSSPFESDDSCKLGRVYVYELPPILNQDLIKNCHDIDPWSSRCNAVSNDGFGPAAVGLDAIIPQNLTPAWYWTDMYAAEVIYHRRMMNYHCRSLNQDEATAFYIPFYVGLAVGKYLWYNYTSQDRDSHSVAMLNWVKNQPPWLKSNGSDHFIMLGRLTWDFRRLTDDNSDWGSSFIYMPLMKNVFRLSVEKNQWDSLETSVPYPTVFQPSSPRSKKKQFEDVLAKDDAGVGGFIGFKVSNQRA